MAAGIGLAGCGGDDNNNSSTSSFAQPRQVADIPVPNVTAGTNFGFDIGATLGTKYYITDRNNAAVDVVDIPTRTFGGLIKGTGANAFAGLNASSAKSGPDGLNVVGTQLYAGDVNSVKIIDPATGAVTKTVVVSATGVRADEGCFDPVHNLYMISSPEENPPFATFIDATTQAIVAKVTFTDPSGQPSGGLEACVYDSASDSFYVNNDGTTANPHGELNKLPGASIRAIARGATQNYTQLAGVAAYPEGNCDPTGLALGPGNDIAVGCREATTGAKLLVQIMDRTNGNILASLNGGGGDALAYDSVGKRYYNAGSRWTAGGVAAAGGACSATSPCTPVLTVIDAVSRTIVAQPPIGNNAHSVAIDESTGSVFVPYSSATAPAGCASCLANGFVNGGITVFALR